MEEDVLKIKLRVEDDHRQMHAAERAVGQADLSVTLVRYSGVMARVP
jgi:hypothetical protein